MQKLKIDRWLALPISLFLFVVFIVIWNGLYNTGYSAEEQSQILSVAVDFATIGALIVGGIWTYNLFIKNRQEMPWAHIEHSIQTVLLHNGLILVRVDVALKNIGNVLLPVTNQVTRIQQVKPLKKGFAQDIANRENLYIGNETDISWPLIDKHERKFVDVKVHLEPKETRVFNHDFLIESDIEVIQIYSYVMNERDPEKRLSWEVTSFIELDDSQIAKEEQKK